MSIALPPTLTGEDIEAFVAMHGARQAVADALAPTFTMPPQPQFQQQQPPPPPPPQQRPGGLFGGLFGN